MWRLTSLILAAVLIFLSLVLYRVGIAEYSYGNTEFSYGNVFDSVKSASELDAPALLQLISELNDLEGTPLYPSRYLEYLGSIHSLLADNSVWPSEKQLNSRLSAQYYAAALEKRGPADSYLRLKLIDALHAQAKPAEEIQNHVIQAMHYRPNIHSLTPSFLWYCLEYIYIESADFSYACRSTFNRFENTGHWYDIFAHQNAAHRNYPLLVD
jgi:hypothetical protein